MSRTAFLLLAALVLGAPATGFATGVDLGRAVRDTTRDSTRAMPRWLHASVGAGVSWMQDPGSIRQRYATGVAFAGAVEASLLPRVRAGIQADYLDLPSARNGYLGIYESTASGTTVLPTSAADDLGKGRVLTALGTLSLRLWRQLRVTGGAGAGHFASGYPKLLFIDGATGEYFRIPGETGWGRAFTAGLAYDFTVRKRDALYVSARWVRLDRDPEVLQLVPIRIGYRFE